MAVEVSPGVLRDWVENGLTYGVVRVGWVNGQEVGVVKVQRDPEGGYAVRVVYRDGSVEDDNPVTAYLAVVGNRR